jgi:orotidine-5'-phosphate decarboxylase
MVLEGVGADAVGINCSLGPDKMLPALQRLAAHTSLPLVVKLNAGLPDPETGEYSLSPDQYAALLEPVMELLNELKRLGELDGGAVGILLRCAGIGMISELAGLLCADAGEGAMGKALQICANAAILWLSLPLLRQVLTMIGEVLAKV